MFLSKLQCEQPDSCGVPVPPCPRFLSMFVLTSALACLGQGIWRWTASTSKVWLRYQGYFLFPQGVWHKTIHADFPPGGPFLALEPSQELWSLRRLTERLPWFLLAFNWPRFKRNCALCPENNFSEYIPNKLWPSQSSGYQHLSFVSSQVSLSLYLTRWLFWTAQLGLGCDITLAAGICLAQNRENCRNQLKPRPSASLAPPTLPPAGCNSKHRLFPSKPLLQLVVQGCWWEPTNSCGHWSTMIDRWNGRAG